MSWPATIFTGLMIGAAALKGHQYHYGNYEYAWQALLFLATAAALWIIYIRALSHMPPHHHNTTSPPD